mmetsp:Transcript_11479/g.21693  ORF Transcript_11479/g.21693 Transcript_11479/m.21693 type:complete len:627 (-) Transcript_11479:335-2215(-)
MLMPSWALLFCFLATSFQLLHGLVDETCAPGTRRHPTFPPFGLSNNDTAEWFEMELPELPPPPVMNAKEREQARWSAAQYIAARKAGHVSCEEYVRHLVKRVRHYKDMNQFMNWDNDPDWTARVVQAAKLLDEKAFNEGIDSIAPLFGLPIPMKGTMATKDFVSSAGVGILHNMRAKDDADLVKLVRSMHGILFGKTNVPEFAASLVTCNYANGCTLNPHGRLLTSGGSSGGAGSAVASYLAPVAISEDTAGSTRSPAFSNGNFGYDPTRQHLPNGGNPGISLIMDQVGLNARSVEDIILVDASLSGYDASAVQAKPIRSLRVGVPRYPFIEAYVPAGGDNPFNYAQEPVAWLPSREVMAKYEDAKAALRQAGVWLVEKEWPAEDGQNVLARAFFLMKMGKEVVSPHFHAFMPFTGQMAQWMHDYLGAGVTVADVINDVQSAGAGHSPSHFMKLCSNTSEAKHNFILQELRHAGVEAWNSLFDVEELDLILTPGLMHTPTYDCTAASTCEHQVKNLSSGEITSSAEFTSIHANFIHTWIMKHVPLPKMIVPVGLDVKGRPVGLQLLGRAGPPKSKGLGYSYDAELLKSIDLPFLKTVEAVAKAMVKEDPTLARVEPQLVRGEGNLF